MKYSKIEFWLMTAFFVIFFLAKLNMGLSEYGFTVSNRHAAPLYITDTLLPALANYVIVYLAFITVNFYAINKLWRANKKAKSAMVTGAALIVSGMAFTVTQSYLSSWIYKQYSISSANITLLSRGFSLAITFFMMYSLYVSVREGLLYLYRLQLLKNKLRAQVLREVIVAIGSWLAVLLLLLGIYQPLFYTAFGTIYMVGLPFCFLIYFINLYVLIPANQNKKLNTFLYIILVLFVALAAGFFEIMLLMSFVYQFSYMEYLVYGWLAPAVLSTGISWWVYLVNEQKYRELASLQSALGSSNANLQFLRSQINPHFLFNILNTLYGSALAEQAEKTAEGVQKLGDMMRFMLHENHMDVIPLGREIEYLNNYIDLQNLRIATSKDINIRVNVPANFQNLSIAPMLLIPFIENAYKHGISFKQPSWIDINLQLVNDTLQLDVSNSLHAEKSNDPEKHHSGVGLNNVKQRLQLLYSGRHSLVIRQTEKEFIANLTLQLS